MRRHRHVREKLTDRRRAADTVEQALAAQGVGEGDRIDGEMLVVELEQHLVDRAVGLVVKGGGRQGDTAVGKPFVRVLQQAGNDPFLRLVAERQGAVDVGQQLLGARDLVALAAEGIGLGHGGGAVGQFTRSGGGLGEVGSGFSHGRSQPEAGSPGRQSEQLCE